MSSGRLAWLAAQVAFSAHGSDEQGAANDAFSAVWHEATRTQVRLEVANTLTARFEEEAKSLRSLEERLAFETVFLEKAREAGELEVFDSYLLACDEARKFCLVCAQVASPDESEASEALSRCSTCRSVYYCSREHQKVDWSVHKKVCKKLAMAREDEETSAYPLAVKTPYGFVKGEGAVKRLSGWDDYWNLRPLPSSSPLATSESARRVATGMLCHVMTLVSGLLMHEIDPEEKEVIVVHVLGCARAESVRGTQLYSDLLCLYPKVRRVTVVGVGPDVPEELSGKATRIRSPSDSELVVSLYKGTYHEFIQGGSSSYTPPDLILAFNSGLHATKELFESWRPTLEHLANLESTPCVFTAYDADEVEKGIYRLGTIVSSEGRRLHVTSSGLNPFGSLHYKQERGRLNRVYSDSQYVIHFHGGPP